MSETKPNSNDYINVLSPQPGGQVDKKFIIEGWLNVDMFERAPGWMDWNISIEFIDSNVKTFMGGNYHPALEERYLEEGRAHFTIEVEFIWVNEGFLKSSNGRIVLKLEFPNEKIEPLYLPVVIKEFENEDTDKPDVIRRHYEVGKLQQRYNQDLKDYYEELGKIYESRKEKDEGRTYDYLGWDGIDIASHIRDLLDEQDEVFESYAYSEEDSREDALNEKYKEALEWQGPLAGGVVSKFNGFEMRVYSNDHDKHFHVIHKEKGIDARFSFPDIKLMNYKSSRATISSKVEKRIREYCLQPEILTRFEKEFNKRELK